MGRSVDYLTGAEYVIYFSCEDLNCYDEERGFYWDDFFRNLECEIKAKLKSYYECEKWDGRETQIFLENELCVIGLSEYCGLYSLSIRAKDDEFYCNAENVKDGLSKHHAQQVRGTLEKCLENCGAKLLNRLGTFSNGNGVYEYAKIK